MAKCAKGIQNAHVSRGQKLTHSPAREEKYAEQETPLHYTQYCYTSLRRQGEHNRTQTLPALLTLTYDFTMSPDPKIQLLDYR